MRREAMAASRWPRARRGRKVMPERSSGAQVGLMGPAARFRGAAAGMHPIPHCAQLT